MREEAFERLYGEHASSLLAFLAYRTGDPVLAEDLLADTFERVLRARSRFDPRKASERTWLYTIALNLVRDHARRRATEQRAVERAGSYATTAVGGSAAERFEDRDELAAGLASLSDPEREVIALRYGADLNAPQIAKLLGERLPAVEARLYRALGRLRDRL